MDKREIHKTIKAKFHLSNKTHNNLPWCSGSRYNRNNLAELFGELNYNLGAEIGVRFGRFSRKFLINNQDLKLYCVDPWDGYDDNKYPPAKQQEIYLRAVKKLSGYNVVIIRKTSMDALAEFKDESLDFVYIDGNHRFDFVCPDIIEWSKKVRSGGIVACHDYYVGEVGVKCAVEAYVHSHNIVPWYATKELSPTAYWVKP